ncbi:MAG: ATP-binding protein [Lysobacter sp.]|nr:MAG: ATP-binding protein [Lysobacter sp.]
MNALDAPPMIETADADARAPGGASPRTWTDALVFELDRRVAGLIASMRDGVSNPALKHLVVTDAEVDHLLSARDADDDRLFAGSLLASLLEYPEARAKLDRLCRAFALDAFELEVLLACLAPDIDRRFDRLFAYVNDDLTKPRPTIDTLLRLLASSREHLPLQRRLLSDSALLRLGLLICDDRKAPRTGMFRVADGVARFLLDYDGVDERIARLRADRDAPALARKLWRSRASTDDVVATLADIFAGQDARSASGDDAGTLVVLRGRAGSGRAHALDLASQRAGIGRIDLDARKFKAHAGEVGELIVAALRDARLHDLAVAIHHADALIGEAEAQDESCAAIRAWLRAYGGCIVLCAEDSLPCPLWFPTAVSTELELPPLAIGEREAAWSLALAEAMGWSGEAALPIARALASKFRLTEAEIAIAVGQARAPLAAVDDDEERARILHDVVGRSATPRLHRLTDAVATRHAIKDLVLPEDRMALIDDIVRRVQHRRTVMEDWSFDDLSPRGKGLIALFHGASGTGKTMAADAVAHSLRMRLFRIDLAGVVSKYIGETEKNLRTIFDEADRMDSVLFFDEADALFGKRSDVKDAHDRYANIEINYLLQRVENFSGIAVLATNKRDHIDEAFLRRIHISVEFPMPQAPERLRLWRRSFPKNAPLSAQIDWDFLARRFEFSGGTIRNAALSAAFLAAESGGEIGMRELVQAVRIEIVKSGRRMPAGEFGRYAEHFERSAGARSASVSGIAT